MKHALMYYLLFSLCVSPGLLYAQKTANVGFLSSVALQFHSHAVAAAYGSVYNAAPRPLLDNDGVLRFYGETWYTSDAANAGGRLVFDADSTQYIAGDTSYMSTLSINNLHDVVLQGDVAVSDSLIFLDGHLILHGNDLVMMPEAGFSLFDQNRFVVTDQPSANGGSVAMLGLDSLSEVVVPLGSSTQFYTPATFTNLGSPDHFSFSAVEQVLDSGASGGALSRPHAGTTWWISEAQPGGCLFNLQLQYASSLTTSDFCPARRFVSMYHNQAPNTLGDSVSTDHWSLSRMSSLQHGMTTGYMTGRSSTSSVFITNRDSIDRMSGFTILSYPSTSVPVTLIDLGAEWLSANVPVFRWTTASELNNERFDVFRSVDGRRFAKLAARASQHRDGTSSQRASYEYVDYALPHDVLTVYYKLVQVDLDGKQTEYGPVKLNRAVPASSVQPMRMYPNPATDRLTIETGDHSFSRPVIRIYNQTGALVMEKELPPYPGQTVHIPLQLSPGIYMVYTGDYSSVPNLCQSLIVE